MCSISMISILLTVMSAFWSRGAGKIAKITASSSALSINDAKISDIIQSKIDGFPDLPDSAFDGWRVSAIYKYAIKAKKESPSTNFVIEIDERLPYMFSKPILLALSDAYISNASLSRYGFPSQKIDVRLEQPSDCGPNSFTKNIEVLISKDSISLIQRSNSSQPILLLGGMSNPSELDNNEILLIKNRLNDNSKILHGVRLIAVDPYPTTPYKKVYQILQIIESYSREKSAELTPFLISVYVCKETPQNATEKN